SWGQGIVWAAAQRAADPLGDGPAVVECDPHLGAEMLAAGRPHLRVRRGVYAPHQRARLRLAECLALEILEQYAAGQERARQAVLHAELGVEPALRIGPVGVGEPARMGPGIDA